MVCSSINRFLVNSFNFLSWTELRNLDLVNRISRVMSFVITLPEEIGILPGLYQRYEPGIRLVGGRTILGNLIQDPKIKPTYIPIVNVSPVTKPTAPQGWDFWLILRLLITNLFE